VTNSWTNTSPELRYSVNFTNTGTYYVWLRGYAETSENVSVYVGLNGNSTGGSQIDLPKLGVWTWANTAAGSTTSVSINVTNTGTNTFQIWMRDAGFRLDRILLTRNANFSAEPIPPNRSPFRIAFRLGPQTGGLCGCKSAGLEI
jgi:hypothetical protein